MSNVADIFRIIPSEKINREDFVEQVKEIKSQYNLTTAELAVFLSVREETIVSFLNNEKNYVENNSKFYSRVMLLFYLNKITPDERLRTYIYELEYSFQISLSMLSKITGISEKSLHDFLVNSEDLSPDEKYNLSIQAVLLRRLLSMDNENI